MNIIEILPKYEAKKFDQPEALSREVQEEIFKIDQVIKERSDADAQTSLLSNITNASIITWQHVNMHGTYDFSNLAAANDNDFNYEEIINFKIA